MTTKNHAPVLPAACRNAILSTWRMNRNAGRLLLKQAQQPTRYNNHLLPVPLQTKRHHDILSTHIGTLGKVEAHLPFAVG